MSVKPRILLVGTADTKSPELAFLRDCIIEAGGEAVYMNVGVLARGTLQADISSEAASSLYRTPAARAISSSQNPAMPATKGSGRGRVFAAAVTR